MGKSKGIMLLAALLILALFIFMTRDRSDKSVIVIPVDESEIITSSKMGYNSVTVYQKDGYILINANSETEFFDDTQFKVETKERITLEDVDIKWSTIGGSHEASDEGDLFIVEIQIFDSGEEIFQEKINFYREPFKMMWEELNKN